MTSIGFKIAVIEPKKRKPFLIQERRDILAEVDVSMERRFALCARLGIVPSTLNTIIQNRKDTKEFYANCGRLCGQTKNPKHSPVKDIANLLSAWLKQVRASNVITSDSVLREKALYVYSQNVWY